MGRIMSESLQDFVETLVQWMRGQYLFDPVNVELPFGEEGGLPAREIDLGNKHRLSLKGRIDRVDIHPDACGGGARCVVVDYKSRQKQLDPLLLENGLQLQLASYLNVLRHLPDAEKHFGAHNLVPVGMFYLSLRGKYDRQENRTEALKDPGEARKLAYQHTGRFDFAALRQLDARRDATAGDQFKYRLKLDGQPHKNRRDPMETVEFLALLDKADAHIKLMGARIFAGDVLPAPYRKGSTIACQQCDYSSICRIDPWTHQFRRLQNTANDSK
jgi:ATP-dependent helicase/nuclease subunit B